MLKATTTPMNAAGQCAGLVAVSWQVAGDAAFNNIVLDNPHDTVNLTQFVSNSLPLNTPLYVRSKHHSANCESDWSQPTPSVTLTLPPNPDPIVSTPSLSVQTRPIGYARPQPILTGSPFSMFFGSGNHVATNWEIIDKDGLVAWDSINDNVNLTTITPSINLTRHEKYKFRVQYVSDAVDSSNNPITSEWVEVEHIVVYRGRLRTRTALPTAYVKPTLIELRNTPSMIGQVVIIGGFDSSYTETTDTYLYDPELDTYTAFTATPIPARAAALWEYNGTLKGYLVDSSGNLRPVSYDFTTDMWTLYPGSITLNIEVRSVDITGITPALGAMMCSGWVPLSSAWISYLELVNLTGATPSITELTFKVRPSSTVETRYQVVAYSSSRILYTAIGYQVTGSSYFTQDVYEYNLNTGSDTLVNRFQVSTDDSGNTWYGVPTLLRLREKETGILVGDSYNVGQQINLKYYDLNLSSTGAGGNFVQRYSVKAYNPDGGLFDPSTITLLDGTVMMMCNTKVVDGNKTSSNAVTYNYVWD